jgi:glutamate-5-semialdehyde dehydrogenase
MSATTEFDLASYCIGVATRAREASRVLAGLPGAVKNRWLVESAKRIQHSTELIARANQLDLDQAERFQLTPAEVDRLTMTPQRIEQIASGLLEIAALPDPVGEVIEGSVRPNGLQISKVRVPIGVIFFIYESRPNVTADAAGIAVKSGNAIILRGGKEAVHSSRAIVEIIQGAAADFGVPIHAVQLVNTIDREAVGHFLKMDQCIDLVIPRGGESLIRRVAQEATMPVLKHYDGNCHIYVDLHADLEMSIKVIENAKCQRMGVCNALESLLVHRKVAGELLPKLAENLRKHPIELRGDDATRKMIPEAIPATEQDWSREYLGPILSVRVVDSLDEAIDHINRYSSHHTDAIMTKDLSAARRFTTLVDSAAVIVNASTRFNDGGQLGMGAEIGISTDKFHARGPCGLRELTTYKYVVYGDGHVRT